jgi:hypothetical protein
MCTKYPTLLGTRPCYVLNRNFPFPKGRGFSFFSVKKVVSFHDQDLGYCSSHIFRKILDVERKNKIYYTSLCGGQVGLLTRALQVLGPGFGHCLAGGPPPSKNALILGHYPLTLNLKNKIGLI